jgi:hypothetical protein
MTSDQYYYRFGNADASDGFLWSGVINTSEPITKEQAKHMIRKSNNINKLPARTMIVSRETLQAHGRYTSNA